MILFVHIPTFGGVALFYFSRSESYAVMPLWFSSAVPLVDSDVEDLFACLFCCLYILFGKMSLRVFAHFLIGFWGFYCSVLKFIFLKCLSFVRHVICKCFHPKCTCLFSLFVRSFIDQTFFISMMSSFSVFPSRDHASGLKPKTVLLSCRSWRSSPILFL